MELRSELQVVDGCIVARCHHGISQQPSQGMGAMAPADFSPYGAGEWTHALDHFGRRHPEPTSVALHEAWVTVLEKTEAWGVWGAAYEFNGHEILGMSRPKRASARLMPTMQRACLRSRLPIFSKTAAEHGASFADLSPRMKGFKSATDETAHIANILLDTLRGQTEISLMWLETTLEWVPSTQLGESIRRDLWSVILKLEPLHSSALRAIAGDSSTSWPKRLDLYTRLAESGGPDSLLDSDWYAIETCKSGFDPCVESTLRSWAYCESNQVRCTGQAPDDRTCSGMRP